MPCSPWRPLSLPCRGTGVLACLDGFMNIAMEQTEEYVNGQLKAKYGDAFIRGNNGATTRAHRHTPHPRTHGPAAPDRPTAPDRRSARGRSLVHFHHKTQGLMRPPFAPALAFGGPMYVHVPSLVSACTPRPAPPVVVWCRGLFNTVSMRAANMIGPRKLRPCSIAVMVACDAAVGPGRGGRGAGRSLRPRPGGGACVPSSGNKGERHLYYR